MWIETNEKFIVFNFLLSINISFLLCIWLFNEKLHSTFSLAVSSFLVIITVKYTANEVNYGMKIIHE